MRPSRRVLPSVLALLLPACATTYPTAPGVTNTVVRPAGWPSCLAIHSRRDRAPARFSGFDADKVVDTLTRLGSTIRDGGSAVGPLAASAALIAPIFLGPPRDAAGRPIDWWFGAGELRPPPWQ